MKCGGTSSLEVKQTRWRWCSVKVFGNIVRHSQSADRENRRSISHAAPVWETTRDDMAAADVSQHRCLDQSHCYLTSSNWRSCHCNTFTNHLTRCIATSLSPQLNSSNITKLHTSTNVSNTVCCVHNVHDLINVQKLMTKYTNMKLVI